MPGFVNVEYNNLKQIEEAYNDNTCAVLIEPVQGEGGVNVPDPDYLRSVQEFCKSKNILFMLDEVQTGMGRLGTLFGYQRFQGVEPDVMTLAKALGSGAPLGAFCSKEFCSVLEPGDHGSTFGGNALTTASGAAAAEFMVENNIPELSLETGKYMMESLSKLMSKYQIITEVRGMGLLIGMEMNKEISGDIVSKSLEKGLLKTYNIMKNY